MGEEAAAVMICCMPSTSSLVKSLQEPVRSWLSNASQRALRLTGSNRTGLPRSGSGSMSNLKGSSESNQDAIDSHPLPQQLHTAWANASSDNYPLQHLNVSNSRVWKKTEIQISRADVVPPELMSKSSSNRSVSFNTVIDRAREKKGQRLNSTEIELDSLYILE